MMGHRTIKESRGFTLAELLIVVAIVAVLVAISVPIFTSRMDRTKATVCEANRKIVLRQILLEQMEDDSFTRDDAEAILEKSDARCPASGTFSVEWEESFAKVNCDRHGASIGGGEDTDIKVSQTFTEDYRQFTVEFLKKNPTKSNNQIREAFLEKYNGKWPTLTVRGESYSIQPYYQGKDKSRPVEECVWLFARPDASAAAGWSVPYVYNIVDNKWYEATKWDGTPGGAANITYSDVNALDEAVRTATHSNGNPQWVEVTDYKESK